MNDTLRIRSEDGTLTSEIKTILIDTYWVTAKDINENTFAIDLVDDENNVFLEGLSKYLNIEDQDKIIDKVKFCYKSKGIPFTKTIEKWLKGITKPSQDQDKRINCYNFCFALDMSFEETFDFFIRRFQIVPFNYKFKIDAIYYYCLKNKREYSTIEFMIEKAKTFINTNNDSVDTTYIHRTIDEIDDDEEFLKYLNENCYDNSHQSMTAKQEIIRLVEADKTIANVSSDSQLFMKIAKYNNQGNGTNEEIYGRHNKGMAGSNLPKGLKKSFPTNKTISDIRVGNDVSDDSLRKTLILLEFYNYYALINDEKIAEEKIMEYCDDFLDECNDLLDKCNYPRLYVRNPYDWVIITCLKCGSPVDALKNILQKMYIENVDI